MEPTATGGSTLGLHRDARRDEAGAGSDAGGEPLGLGNLLPFGQHAECIRHQLKLL